MHNLRINTISEKTAKEQQHFSLVSLSLMNLDNLSLRLKLAAKILVYNFRQLAQKKVTTQIQLQFRNV